MIALGLVTACYAPASEAPCTVSCATSGSCPGSLTCGSDGVCRGSDGTCGPTTDGPGDGGGAICYGAPGGLRRICLAAAPTLDVSFESSTIDTSVNSPACAPYPGEDNTPETELCLIAARTLRLPAGVTVKLVGTRPVVLLGTTLIEIGGVLDVSSRSPTEIGAGGSHSRCVPDPMPVGASGGWGGTFFGAGGKGGTTPSDMSPVVPSLPGAPLTTPEYIRGGCRGQAGGAFPGDGGAGGGAVYLISQTSIVVTGVINASGGPGTGGGLRGGGGGGGSGGMIGFDSQVLSAGTASLFANGGGGGCGSTSMAAGENGGIASAPNAPGRGCRVNGAGSFGGDGSSTLTDNGTDGSRSTSIDVAAGGGGGGGGLLYVIPAANIAGLSGALMAPPPRSN